MDKSRTGRQDCPFVRPVREFYYQYKESGTPFTPSSSRPDGPEQER